VTKHTIVELQLARSAVATIAGGAAAVAALLLGAGYIEIGRASCRERV